MKRLNPTAVRLRRFLGAVALFLLSGLEPAHGETAFVNETMVQAQKLKLSRIQVLDDGIYAKRNGAVYFLRSGTTPKMDDQFYWTMVRVLSEKFGCFMVDRDKTSSSYSFTCRDGRNIVMKHGIVGSTKYFVATQFDKRGKQILLTENKIKKFGEIKS